MAFNTFRDELKNTLGSASQYSTIAGQNTTQSPLLTDLAAKNALGVNYDKATNMVTVLGNGNTYKFAPGKAPENLGLTFDPTTQRHYVADSNKFLTAMGEIPQATVDVKPVTNGTGNITPVTNNTGGTNAQVSGQSGTGENFSKSDPDLLKIINLYGESKYENQINDNVNKLLNKSPYQSTYSQNMMDNFNTYQNSQFNYDPSTDKALKLAQNEVNQKVLEEMNTRGIVNSSIASDSAAWAMAKLIPEYEEKAYKRYIDNLNKNLQSAQFLKSVNKDNYDIFSDEVKRISDDTKLMQSLSQDDLKKIQNILQTFFDKKQNDREDKKLESQNKVKQYEQALDRLKLKGYVATNEDALLLGVPINTPSEEAQKRAYDLIGEEKKSQIRIAEQLAKDENKQKLDNKELEEKSTIAQNVGAIKIAFANKTPDELLNYLKSNRDEVIGAIKGEAYSKLIDDAIKAKDTMDKDTTKKNYDIKAGELESYLLQLSPEDALNHIKTTANAYNPTVGPDNYRKILDNTVTRYDNWIKTGKDDKQREFDNSLRLQSNARADKKSEEDKRNITFSQIKTGAGNMLNKTVQVLVDPSTGEKTTDEENGRKENWKVYGAKDVVKWVLDQVSDDNGKVNEKELNEILTFYKNDIPYSAIQDAINEWTDNQNNKTVGEKLTSDEFKPYSVSDFKK